MEEGGGGGRGEGGRGDIYHRDEDIQDKGLAGAEI